MFYIPYFFANAEILYIFANVLYTVKPVFYGKAKNWLLKTGACLIQVDFHFFVLNGI